MLMCGCADLAGVSSPLQNELTDNVSQLKGHAEKVKDALEKEQQLNKKLRAEMNSVPIGSDIRVSSSTLHLDVNVTWS